MDEIKEEGEVGQQQQQQQLPQSVVEAFRPAASRYTANRNRSTGKDGNNNNEDN